MALENYGVFDLNVQVESTTGATGDTGKSKTKPPRVPRAPRGLLFLNTQVKNALIAPTQFGVGAPFSRPVYDPGDGAGKRAPLHRRVNYFFKCHKAVLQTRSSDGCNFIQCAGRLS